ncbi:MAG TPA: saccharopine dehydrogenase C-terminal domain-containing protein, partial [Rhodothermales bacterium]|nr:saccharopine dehydrogenase C-terminal domain-containing protein [Rhodothermales bacterium]
MKLTVLGAGAIGATVARDLAQADDVETVQVCDARARSLTELQATLSSPKLRSFQADARDPLLLRSIIAGSACVVGCVPGALNPALSELCIELGVPFTDLGSTDEIVDQQLRLHETARDRGVWIVPNCGLTPGLVNVLCLHGIEAFEQVDAAQIRVGDIPQDPTPPFNFSASWSVEKVLDDYTSPVEVIEDGLLTTHAPLSHVEEIHFDPPYDHLEAFDASGLSTLARQLQGQVRCLDHKLIRWPGHAGQMQFLVALGLAESIHIDVQTHLTYRDVLLRRMRQHLSADLEDVLLMRVLVRGLQGGRRATRLYEMVIRYDEATQTTAIRRCTSIPISTLALMLG